MYYTFCFYLLSEWLRCQLHHLNVCFARCNHFISRAPVAAISTSPLPATLSPLPSKTPLTQDEKGSHAWERQAGPKGAHLDAKAGFHPLPSQVCIFCLAVGHRHSWGLHRLLYLVGSVRLGVSTCDFVCCKIVDQLHGILVSEKNSV